MTADERFALALERAQKRPGQGIGTQSERLIHSTIKYYLEPDDSCHEVRVGDYIADIFQKTDGHIYEIQTRGFDRLRDKLSSFLKNYRVTVVHPVVREKYLCWVDPDTGEIAKRRRSPRRGSPIDILPEIYRLPNLQTHPNLRFMAFLLDVEEYRLLDGWSRDKKKGSHRMERLPLAIQEPVMIGDKADYIALLPALPEPFTRKALAASFKLSPRNTAFAVRVLERAECIEQIGKQGREYVYRVIK